MKLTNNQILEAEMALSNFNPAVRFSVKNSLNRNLRQLTSARKDFEHDRERIRTSMHSDKSKRPDNTQQGLPLTPEEQLRFQAELKLLLQEEVEVDIRPVEVFDHSEGTEPKDPKHAIDISEGAQVKVTLPNDIYSRLIDIVLIPIE